MSLWRQLTHGLRALTHRAARDRDLDDEVDHFLALAAGEWEAKGLSPEQARRAARLEVGPTASVRQQIREYGWENIIDTIVADVRYGARRLRHSPTFTVVAVLTLGLGIGASTAIFSAVNPILFEALPYPRSRQLVMVWDTGLDGLRLDVTFGSYRELAARSRSFDALAVMRAWQPTLSGFDQPERLDGQRVTASYFDALGISPRMGRDFDPAEDLPNAASVAIISDGLWRRRFGGDAAIIGRQVSLNEVGYTIVGVMPRDFENVLAPTAEIWTTLQYDPSLPADGREWGHHLRLVARLRGATSVAQADRELEAIAQSPIPEFKRPFWAAMDKSLAAVSLRDDVTRAVRPALVAVLGAVLLLVVIACVNVTNLLLARGVERRSEFALRAALGAPRRRLLRQLLTESLLLAALGGGVGLVLANTAVRVLVSLAPIDLPRPDAVGLDAAVFAFAGALTTLIGVLVAVVPARQASRVDLVASIQQGSPRIVASHQTTRRALVVVQVALALVLLAGAGLLLRSLDRLLAVPPGFDPAGVLTMQVQVSGRRYDDQLAIDRFFAQALDAVRVVPGVSAAAFTSQLPLSGDYDMYGVHFESSPLPPSNDDRGAFRYAVSPDYLEAMGIALKRGRGLTVNDRAGAPLAVLLNDTFARRRFGDGDPIGQRLHVGPNTGPWFTIVGVVDDVKQTSLEVAKADAVYMTGEQWSFSDRSRWFVVKTGSAGGGAALVAAIRQAIWSVDKNQAIVRVASMEQRVADSAAERRFAMIVLEAFGAIALVLAAIGIYGVLAGSVNERTREIGVRAALGASRTTILGLIVRQGLVMTACGIGLGLIAAVLASDLLISLLFGVSRLDVLTYASVVIVLSAVAAIACWIPAWRAVRIPASIALLSE
jgi:putative ABC transport system permease protein